MAEAFMPEKGKSDRIVGKLDHVEREVLIDLLNQASALLTDGSEDPGEPAGAPASGSPRNGVGKESTLDSASTKDRTTPSTDHGSDERSSSSSREDELFASLQMAMEQSQKERTAPADPALLRLLPDGVKGDDEAAAEFRRLTEANLRRTKLTNLETAMSALEAAGETKKRGLRRAQPVVLTRAEARALLLSLTDVRLILAERLDVHTEEDAEALSERTVSLAAPENERDLMGMYYDFITWLSESLSLALMPSD